MKGCRYCTHARGDGLPSAALRGSSHDGPLDSAGGFPSRVSLIDEYRRSRLGAAVRRLARGRGPILNSIGVGSGLTSRHSAERSCAPTTRFALQACSLSRRPVRSPLPARYLRGLASMSPDLLVDSSHVVVS